VFAVDDNYPYHPEELPVGHKHLKRLGGGEGH